LSARDSRGCGRVFSMFYNTLAVGGYLLTTTVAAARATSSSLTDAMPRLSLTAQRIRNQCDFSVANAILVF